MSVFDMFDNSGKKIKDYAFLLFGISLVADFILAIIFGKDRWGDFNLALFCLIFAVGAMCAYLNSLFLSAFGELVENMAECNSYAEKVAEEVENMKKMLDNSENSANINISKSEKADTDCPNLNDSCTHLDS